MIILKGHKKSILSLALSPDNKLLASASIDATVRLWDTTTQKEILSWPGCAYHSCVTFSPDGKLLAWVGDATRVWRLENPKRPELASKKGGQQICFSSAFELAVQGTDKPLWRWYSSGPPNGRRIFFRMKPGDWGRSRDDYDDKQFPTGCIAYHPSGELLASSFAVLGKHAYDSVIHLWDTESGKLRGQLHAEFTVAHPTAIAFSPDGTLLAGIYGPALRVWDLATASEIAKRQPGKKHFKGLAFTPDGGRLVTVSNDHTVRLWDTASWTEVGGYEWQIGSLGAVAVAPDGFRMAAGGGTGKIVIWDVE